MIMMRSADGKVALDAGAKDEENGSAKCHSGNKLFGGTLFSGNKLFVVTLLKKNQYE